MLVLMNKTVRIKQFEEKDKAEVVRLLSDFYNNIDSEPDWKHHYIDSPAGESIISLIECCPDNGIFGHFSVIKILTSVFGQTIIGGKGEGEIVDLKSFKRLIEEGVEVEFGISNDLVQHATKKAFSDGVKIICTNPNDFALKSHLKCGYKNLKHKFSIFIFPFSTKYAEHVIGKRVKIEFLAKLLGYLLRAVLFAFQKLTILFSKNDDIEFEYINEFDERIDDIFSRFVEYNKCVTTDRNYRHLNWRFSSEQYKNILVKHNGEIIGYMVLSLFKNSNGFTEVNVVDYILTSDNWKLFRNIVLKIMIFAMKEKCDLLRINYMHDYKERFGISRILSRLLFLKREDRRNIVLTYSNELSVDASEVLNVNNWFFTDLYFEDY